MKLNNNLNYDLNERLYKLINNKKLVLLIPGVIITVIAVILLIMAVFPANGRGNDRPTLALNDRGEVAESETVETKDYLASLDSEVAENLHILTQDNYVMDSETVLTQYESLEQRLKELLTETATFLESSTSTSAETVVMLTEVSKELETIRADLQSSRESYEEMLERILANGGKLENLGADLQKSLDEESRKMQAELTSKVWQLTERLTTLKAQIESSQTETKNLFVQLESTGSDKQAEINNSFSLVMEELADMRTLVNQAEEQYRLALVQLSSTLGADIGGVHSRLDKLDFRIEQHDEWLDGELKRLFTSVSDGKALVASTITDTPAEGQGIYTAEDATFFVISENIKALYLKGLQEGLGSVGVEYEYHWHKDGNGTETASQSIYLSQYADNIGIPAGAVFGEMDGCYNEPIYHRHLLPNGTASTASYSTTRGGCYQQQGTYTTTHTHSAACGRCTATLFTEYVSTCPSQPRTRLTITYECSEPTQVHGPHNQGSPHPRADTGGYCCNGGSWTETRTHWHCGKTEGAVTDTAYYPACGLELDTVVAYAVDCGRYHGEMVSAKIVFPPSLEP